MDRERRKRIKDRKNVRICAVAQNGKVLKKIGIVR